MIAALVAAAWIRFRLRDSVAAGILIGIAVTLKLFPILLLIPLLAARRFRASVWLAGTALTLHIAGSLIFGITTTELLVGLSETSRAWLGFGANASLAGLLFTIGFSHSAAGALSWLVVIALAWWLIVGNEHFDAGFAVAITLAVLGSPLSWEHYDIVLLPVVAWLYGWRKERFVVAGVSTWVALVTLGRFVRVGSIETTLQLVRTIALFSRLAVLAVSIVEIRRSKRDSQSLLPSDETDSRTQSA